MITKNVAAFSLASILAVGLPLLAQQNRGGVRNGTGPVVDTSSTIQVLGTVQQFTAGVGAGTPTLVVDADSGSVQSFVLGPYHILRDQGFVAEAGDRVDVKAFACTSCASGYVVASVVNVSRGITLTLRNDDGTPSWLGTTGTVRRRLNSGGGGGVGAGGQGAAAGVVGGQGQCGGTGPDMSQATTFAGTVASFSGGAGQGFPVLTLDTASGAVEIMASPFRALSRAGFVPTAGQALTVVAAPVSLDGATQWVAVSIQDPSTGLVVTLRDADSGTPLRGAGRGRGGRGQGAGGQGFGGDCPYN